MCDNEARGHVFAIFSLAWAVLWKKMICQIMPRRSRLGLQKLCFKLQRFLKKSILKALHFMRKPSTATESQFEGDKTAQIWESLFLSSSNEWAISTALSQIVTPVSSWSGWMQLERPQFYTSSS